MSLFDKLKLNKNKKKISWGKAYVLKEKDILEPKEFEKSNSKSLTKKQQIVFLKIKEFVEKNGYSPTMREVCKICNVSSTYTASYYLYKLKEKGYIDFKKGSPRTIKIMEENDE